MKKSKKSITKAQIVNQIKEKILSRDPRKKITQQTILLVLDTLFETFKENLAEGNHIELRGFGSFDYKIREPKKTVIPNTKKIIVVDKHAVPVFKPGVELKRVVKESKMINLD